MHKLQGIAVTVIMFIGMLMAFEAMIPAADGATVGIMGLLWAIIKPLFLQDWCFSIVLFVIGSIALYGTVHLSRKREQKVWSIATGIVSFLSYCFMFVKCSRGN